MGRFAGFYTGDDTQSGACGFRDSETFNNVRDRKEKEAAHKLQLDVWDREYQQCNTRNSLEMFVKRHKSDSDNPYVEQAKAKIEYLDFEKCKQGDSSAVTEYMRKYPNGRYMQEAKNICSKKVHEELSRKDSSIDLRELFEWIYGIAVFGVFAVVFYVTYINGTTELWPSLGISASSAAPVFFFGKWLFDW